MASDKQWVSQEVYDAWMRRGWPSKGDVILTTEAPLGNVAQVIETRIALAQRVILMKPEPLKIVADYLAFALRSRSFQEALHSHATGSTALGIKADRLKALKIPVPSLEVQRQIVSVIRGKDEASKYMIHRLECQIALLQEHRQALITAAVMGELDVPMRVGCLSAVRFSWTGAGLRRYALAFTWQANRRHACGLKVRAGPWRFLVSRTSTRSTSA